MQKNLFIGIDFSKNKFDVTIINGIEQRSFPQEMFDNDLQGYKNLLKWVVNSQTSSVRIGCFAENTRGFTVAVCQIFYSKRI